MTILVFVVLFLASIQETMATEHYRSVTIQSGVVRVVTTAGKVINPPADDGQVEARYAAVADDQRTVGWLALYPECQTCGTNYMLPLKLIILHNGQIFTVKGSSGEPIWVWRFVDRGKRVAFMEETQHGSKGTHYELWDVASAKRVADYTPTYDRNGNSIAYPRQPKWVKPLRDFKGWDSANRNPDLHPARPCAGRLTRATAQREVGNSTLRRCSLLNECQRTLQSRWPRLPSHCR